MDSLQKEAVQVANRSDYFFQEAILESVAGSGYPLEYHKRDFLFKPGKWRDVDVAPAHWSGRRAVIVVGHSDYELTAKDAVRLAALALPRAIFASNLTAGPLVRKILCADYLPLGLSNPTLETARHEIFGDWSLVRDVALEGALSPRPHEARVYANFDSRTAPEHRDQLAGICRELDHIDIGTIEVSQAGRLAYLREMRDAGLVLCPRGNGPDTHRFYEALYVGALPVVLSSSYAAKIANRFRLPHLALATWSELYDLENLRLRAATVRSERCSLEWITKSAWLAKFEELVP